MRRKWWIHKDRLTGGWSITRPNCWGDMASVWRTPTFEEAIVVYLRESNRFRDQAKAWGLKP